MSSLDGLRGLACLCVFNEHMTKPISETFYHPYGSDYGGFRYHFLQLPPIRLFWCGASMVDIFFVISGYVLSLKALSCIQDNDMVGFNKTVTSALVRRGMRLYLPVIAAIFGTGLLAWLGAFEISRRILATHPASQLAQDLPPSLPVVEQIQDCLHATWSAFTAHDPGPYGLQLWTIPVEFRGSLMLFLLMVSVARLRTSSRLCIELICTLYAIRMGVRVLVDMIAGMFLADLDLLLKRRQLGGQAVTPSRANIEMTDLQPMPTAPMASKSTFSGWERFQSLVQCLSWHDCIHASLFCVGLLCASIAKTEVKDQFAMSIPLYVAHLLEHVGLSSMPEGNSIRAFGAILLTWVSANNTTMTKALTTHTCVYLGKISFALYIVHIAVIKLIEVPVLLLIYTYFWGVAGPHDCSTAQIVVTWLITYVVVLACTLWLADIFHRAVDAPSVRFVRWLEERLSRKN